MAGGIGARFWPMSRKKTPKQTLALLSEQAMLLDTLDRLKQFIPQENIFVSTRKEMQETIQAIVPEQQLIIEPLGKNTAPSIGLAAEYLYAKDKDAVVAFFPSDHYVENEKKFAEDIKVAIKEAEKGKLVTIGMKPTRASTALGYIEKGDSSTEKVFMVKRFVEKPPVEQAVAFVESGNYLWNVAMFVFKAEKILSELKAFEPAMHEGLERIRESGFDEAVTLKAFEAMDKIQIDHAVMERTKDLLVVEADFGWEDVADYAAIGKFIPKDKDGNAVKGRFLGFNSKDNVVYSKKLIAGIDIKDLIIVETDDAILVCPRKSSQKTKELIEYMQDHPEYQKYL
jgi:mannose-1-phosphate guanylyltransferase